jgi:UDP-N-acetylmuramoyl-tripeptide--D-alanyl-D-alanine ligase
MNTAAFTHIDIAELFGAKAASTLPSGWSCVGVSTDTRSLVAGNVFVALVGEWFDAHTLVAEAAQKGAAGAIVARAPEGVPEGVPSDFPCILVPNTLHALGQLAHKHRSRFQIPLIAIAGAAGKTTTKDMTAHVLARHFGGEDKVLKTEGNLNNQVGVPLMLLRLAVAHQAAVVEIGTNEPGEIEILSQMVQPTHGLITNIGKEHLEKLVDIDGVEREETALFRYLERTGGIAFVNFDDDRLRKHAAHAASPFSYGIAHKADLTASVELQPTGEPLMHFVYKLGTQRAKASVQLRVLGRTMAQNALAAASVGCSLGMSLAAIVSALIKFTPTASDAGYGRMVVEDLAGIMLLNDCYNANPVSMNAALDTVRSINPATGGKRIALLGDMRELGDSSFEEHCALLQSLSNDASLKVVVLVGADMECAYNALHSSLAEHIRHFSEIALATETVASMLHTGDVLLVKGSRGVRLEQAVHDLKHRFIPHS